MASQPIPTVTTADVERVVRRDFSADRVAHVLAMLEEYGRESWHGDPCRVRLAALKLAAGNIEQLRHEIAEANIDYRDVLAPAEYPGYLTRVPSSRNFSPEEKQRIIDADWKQYQDWLTR